MVANRTPVRGALLEALQRCRAVGRLGVGLDNIDVPGCEARGIAVLPATGANARSVAEYVITCLLLLRRPGSFTATAGVAAGAWPRPPARLGDEAVGVVGFGAIGQLTARLARGLGLQVLAHARRTPPDLDPALCDVPLLPLAELLTRCDVLSLHLPLTDATRGLIGAAEIARMKPGAVLINTARGAIVDGAAVVEALRRGHLRGAALDVFDTEPLPADSVFADPPPGLLLSPHVGSSTVQSEARVSERVADRLLHHLAGGPASRG
ncbi:NAD(P)-dependent oxidoreductase [Piscinibacter sakaiensis]|uniref:NAD(P)-dependent oxidoreductase n=1 Tax=Piscinibacter sakaiensis TaxID=1547922 RepID=UPI003726E730